MVILVADSVHGDHPTLTSSPAAKEFTISAHAFDEEIRRLIETSAVEVLDSHAPDSRRHEILNNPHDEG